MASERTRLTPVQWEVTLRQVENGYVVAVGCKSFVFTSYKELEKELGALFNGQVTVLSKQYGGLNAEVGSSVEETERSSALPIPQIPSPALRDRTGVNNNG